VPWPLQPCAPPCWQQAALASPLLVQALALLWLHWAGAGAGVVLVTIRGLTVFGCAAVVGITFMAGCAVAGVVPVCCAKLKPTIIIKLKRAISFFIVSFLLVYIFNLILPLSV
jgi:hypothetical protein